MPYILPEPLTFLNIKLTDHGRRLASVGNLTLDSVVVSDREINYKADRDGKYNMLDNRILDISHYYPDIDPANFDGSSPFSSNEFKVSSDKVQITSTTISSSVSTHSRGTGTLDYSSNISNWGTNKVTFDSVSYTVAVNDVVFIPWVDPDFSGSYSMASLPQTQPSVVSTYKIISAVTSTVFLLDRPIPDFLTGADPTLTCEFYYDNLIEGHIGTGKTTDPGIWNMNIVRTQNVAGAPTSTVNNVSGYTNYGSIEFNGTMQFFGFGLSTTSLQGLGNGNPPAFGIIHYTNKYTGNTYAEQFIEGTFELNLPTVMWHHSYVANYDNTGTTFTAYNSSGTTWGLYLSDELGATVYDDYAKSTFRYLYDSKNTGITVGRVYHKLKLVLITDQELLTALTYKSNRNYTLPPFSLTTSTTPQIGLYSAYSYSGNSSVSGLTATGLVKDGFDYFITYIAENSGYSQGTSIGNAPAMHCGYITQILGNTDSDGNPQYLKLEFPYPNSFPYMRDESALSSGQYTTGWNANTVQVLLNIQPTDLFYDINTVPADQWIRVSDKTIGGNGVYRASDWGETTIDPKKLNSYSFVISQEDYNSGSTYTLNSGMTLNQNYLNFGDEYFVYGTVRTGILASAYKMKVMVYIPDTHLNGTDNSTYDFEYDKDVYITEVALISQGTVVAVGKPTYPIRKSNTRWLTLQLDYDF
jgi:hypothetical protein